MSLRLTPVPHALPAAKPPSPVRPALKLAVRLNPDGAPLVLPPGHVPGFAGFPGPPGLAPPQMPHATVSLPTSPTNVALTPPVEARPPPPLYQVEGSTPQGYYLPPEAYDPPKAYVPPPAACSVYVPPAPVPPPRPAYVSPPLGQFPRNEFGKFQCGNQPVRQAGLEVLFTILAASTQRESAWCPRTRRLRLTHPNV